ncbi:MAG: transglycosylase [Cyanobacteriota bacterium]|nr:transglycosylase [Cyanobacteriota bacterium]
MDQIRLEPIPAPIVATSALVPLFAPYCGEPDLRRLEQGLARLQVGQLSGSRLLQGGDERAFALQWSGGLAPLEPLSCQLRFAQLSDVQYSFALPAHRLLGWLLELPEGNTTADLPDAFWRWLILGVDPAAAA